MKEDEAGQVVELFNQLPQELNDTQRREKTLLATGIKLAQKDFAGTQNLLAKTTPVNSEQNRRARYWQAKIDASQGRPPVDLLYVLTTRESLPGAKEKQQNIDATWQALSPIVQEQANMLVISVDEDILQGWLDLQRVQFGNRSDPDMVGARIVDRQKRYPNDPDAKMLLVQLVNVKAFKPASTNKVAPLLPLNGQTAVFNRIIQQGFEAAKNIGAQPVMAQVAVAPTADIAEQPQPQTVDGIASPAQASVSDLTGEQPVVRSVPVSALATSTAAANAPANPSTELRIYDASSQPLSQILSQVQQDGVSIVVGPLLKNNVGELLRSNTPLNVLTLNQPENTENRVNICYFALSPEDEARGAVCHIRDQGRQALLVLVLCSLSGSRIANAFAQGWQKLDGGTVLQQRFGSTNELRTGVNGGSGIALMDSPITSRETTGLGMVTDNPMPQTTPTDDQFVNNGGRADAVYIVATPDEIVFIEPMTAMHNGSQNDAIPYTSPRNVQGTADPDPRPEMEGLRYSEIPMLAGSSLSLMQQVLSAVNNDYSLARMYTMGVDIWSLANHFPQMRQVQDFEINGNTGSLAAGPDYMVNRRLSWLRHQQGQVVPTS